MTLAATLLQFLEADSHIIWELTALHREFEETQARYARKGAQSKLATSVFHHVLFLALFGQKVMPKSPSDWYLQAGAHIAFNALNAVAEKAADLIINAAAEDHKVLKKYIQRHFPH